MKAKIISLLFITLLITACNPAKRLQRICENCPVSGKSDSVYIETIKLDTFIITAPGDTTYIEMPVTVLEDLNIKTENKDQKVTIKYEKGKVAAQAICKDDSLEVVIKELRTDLSHQETKVIYKDKEVIKYRSRKVFIYSFIILIVLVIVGIIVVYVKFKTKILGLIK